MKYGFRTGGFNGWKVEDIVRKLKELGFDGAELCLEPADMRPENFTQARATELRTLMDNIGLEIASVSYHADFEDSMQRLENTFKSVDIANWLGADVLIINSERVEESEKTKRWSELASMLKELCAKAEKLGVYIAIEPEPLQIINDTKDMLKMIDEVGSPNLKTNIDIGHAYITDPSLIESIKTLGDAIVHAHIEDIKDKVHNHLEIGQGDIDLKAMDFAFKEIGYDGYYVVDLFRLGDDPAGVAERTIKALRQTF